LIENELTLTLFKSVLKISAVGKTDMEQWQASNLNPVGLTEVFKAIPISKTAKRKVNKILNYFKHYFLADPKVALLIQM
jgi:hypothetical protein